VTEATQRAGIESQVKAAAEGKTSGATTATAGAARLQSLARDMQGIVDNGYLVIGSPDEVAEQLRELATTLNVAQLMLLLQFGNLPSETVKYNTRLFAEQVIPKLRPLFGEWENRWWPKPLAQGRRAAASAFTPAAAAE
jgi:alkanesulfonate monooxygenase SsuD/methylene tetrahydromethanopterin reductase-like flavin-dependent oxidoreductase (luciferase family)